MHISQYICKGIEVGELYGSLIKSYQTGLLVTTGIAGYLSAVRIPALYDLAVLAGTLFLAVSGSTILNMVYDRDIDALMDRTKGRPLPAGLLGVRGALWVGFFTAGTGLLWALTINLFYASILLLGIFLDIGVYTIWLKRKTAWSIVLGGISGGMPILAGRVFALGQIDIVGLFFAVAILLWIPSHIMTFSMNYYEDYRRARIPTFYSEYGSVFTRLVIAFSTLGAIISLGTGAILMNIAFEAVVMLGLLSCAILVIAIIGLLRPSLSLNMLLFKYASIYMLGAMLLISIF